MAVLIANSHGFRVLRGILSDGGSQVGTRRGRRDLTNIAAAQRPGTRRRRVDISDRRDVRSVAALASVWTLLAATLVFLPATAAQGADVGCGIADIAGTVYRDYDADGTADAGEPGEPGLTITAYDVAGAPVAAATTDASGAWSLTVGDGAMVRVEVTGLASFLEPGPRGPDSLTTVFTATQGSAGSCDLDVGVANPGQYCQADPDLVTSCFIEGPSTGVTDGAVVRFPDSSGYRYAPGDSPLAPAFSGGPGLPPATEPAHDAPLPAYPATVAEVGSTFGVAHERTSGDVFLASFLKRHAGFGPTDSSGTIYRVDGATGAVSVFTEVAATGANPHPNATTNFFFDNNSFDLIGAAGLGDLDIADDDQTLYTVNLATRELVAIPIDTPLAQTTYPIPTGACAVGGDARPFGLGVHDGVVYIGVTCSGETNQLQTDMSIHVLAFDGVAVNPVPVVDAPIDPVNYPHPGFGAWNPWFGWANKPPTIDPDPGIDTTVVPQPWLTDIDFDGNDMILAIRDRTADQFGSELGGVDPTETNFTDIYRGQGFGDILRACGSPASGWTLESGAACGATVTAGVGNSGPGGGEYYFEDHYLDAEDIAVGAVAQIPGRPGVATVAWDPIFITNFYNDGGIIWLDNATGARTQAYRIFDTDGDFSPTFAKSNGLGDLHAVCAAAPIEIGNYVWLDDDGDGLQDPGESPLAGVTVDLFDAVSGALVASTATDASGHYYFGSGDGVRPETTYELRLSGAPLSGLALTTQDSPAGTDLNDSDGAILPGGGPGLVITTGLSGANDHTFDFGFTPFYDLALRLTVDPTYTGPAVPGSDVPFVIEVFNQGGALAGGIEISNYVQPGFTFDPAKNPAWTAGPTPTVTLAAPVAPAASVTSTIVLTVDPGFTGSLLTNQAEISNDDGDDVDSIADSVQGNDPTIDDEIDDPGVADEDDHDIASVAVGAVASIGDRVWFDTDQDGIQDAGEPGVSGITVALTLADLTPVATTATDANGAYAFDNLAPGDYRLTFTIPVGFTVSPLDAGTDDSADSDVDPATNMTIATSLDPGENDLSWDLGIFASSLSSIGDRVWFDTDQDGIQDPGEPGVPGITVTLEDGAGTTVATTVTDGAGGYSFTDLTPGVYQLTFTVPAAYSISPRDAGIDDSVDSDADVNTAMSAATTLEPGENDTRWDLGIYTLDTSNGSISGGMAFNDTNSNGLQDPGEPPLSGVVVNLIDITTGAGVATTTTDADGRYAFSSVPPGTYRIVPVAPAGGTIIAPAGGQSGPITVVPALASPGVDIAIAGDILPATGYNSDVVFTASMLLLIFGSSLVILASRFQVRRNEQR